MRRHGYLFRQLVKLIAAVTVPLVALVGYNLAQSASQAERDALKAVENYAIAISQDLDVLLSDAGNYLEYVAARPLVIALDPKHCDPILDGIVKRRRHFANVLITDLEGRPVCTSIQGPGVVPETYAAYPWFKQAAASESITYSKPFRAPIAQRIVSAMSRPVRDANGRHVGTVSVLFDLNSLREDWARYPLPESSRLTVYDSEGTVLVTSIDFDKFVGTDASQVIKKATETASKGASIAQGIDGVERVFALKPVVQANWLAAAAVPSNSVFASSTAQLRRTIAITAVVLLLVLAFALAMARKLSAPLNSLARTAREIAKGRYDLRVSEDVPGEFNILAEELNAMLEARQDFRVKELRQIDFYSALSRTNGAIVRMPDAQSLFTEICRICLQHGHASIAYVSLVRGDELEQVASAGPAEQFLSGFSVRRSGNSFPGVTGYAVTTGEIAIVNDCEADERAAPWREVANKLGTRSLAAFPLTSNGEVIGALTLHMTVEDFFDERVVSLATEMAGDMSFALENFARERARADAEEALAQQQRQLAGLVDTAMDAIISIDATFSVVLFNRAASELFLVTPDDAIGGSVERFLPSRLHSVHQQHVTAFARTGSTARRMGGLHTLVGLRADGTEFPVEASISKTGEGSAALMTVVARDATSAQQAERARIAQAEAESASRAKTEFLSKMSHELRTPLNAVLGFSQLLQYDEKDRLSSKHQELVRYVREAGAHLLALIDDVLDVSRIEAGNMAVERRSVELIELLNEAMRLNDGAARERKVKLLHTYRKVGRALVSADPRRLKQVMINLLSNAIKYNRAGGQVEVKVLKQGQSTVVVVDDTGMGMNPTQLGHLFEPFNRLGRERESAEGTGLGLALSRELVQLMHGELRVTSEALVGTHVEVALLSLAEDEQTKPMPLDDVPEGDEHSAPSGVVLYIEDNPVNIVLVEHLLMPWTDVTLLKAETGIEGLELAASRKPDVILLDMRLPDMDGVEVMGRLFSNPASRGCPVVALSASAMPDEVEAATKAGAIFYWTKPLDFKHFLRGMRNLLRKT